LPVCRCNLRRASLSWHPISTVIVRHLMAATIRRRMTEKWQCRSFVCMAATPSKYLIVCSQPPCTMTGYDTMLATCKDDAFSSVVFVPSSPFAWLRSRAGSLSGNPCNVVNGSSMWVAFGRVTDVVLIAPLSTELINDNQSIQCR
jgi:hypothetical protein